MRTTILILAVIGFCTADAATRAEEARDSYLEYKFNDLDEATRTAITRFNSQLVGFSEGCVAEQEKATWSLLDAIAADAECGLALHAAWKTPGGGKFATGAKAVAVAIACGFSIPKVLRDRAERKENLKTCKELDAMLSKYKTYCEGKTRVVFAFEDALYCYSPVDGGSVLILDMKKRTVLVKKP